MKSRKRKDTTAYIQELEARIEYMEEGQRRALEAVEQAIALGDFQSTVSGMAAGEAVLTDTLRRIGSLIPFQATAIYLVDADSHDFNLAAAMPQGKAEAAVESLINDGTFALALRERRMVTATAADGRKASLHVLATRDKVIGMFAGLLGPDGGEVYDISLALLPLILLSSANALETIALYKIIHDMNRDLRAKVVELAASERELEKRRRNLHEQVAERTAELTAAMSRLQAEIDHRREMEAELKKAKDKAEAANRAKSEFLAVVSHEIRTPMTSIIGMAELLTGETTPQERDRYARTLISASDTLLALIDDILDFSKIEAGRMVLETRPFAPREILDKTSAVFEHTAASKKLAFTHQTSPDVPELVTADPDRLRQVLVNLLGNAFKFTKQGHITVRLGWSPETPTLPSSLVCAVSDTGIGIPPDKLSIIFDSFTQADSSTTRQYGGTGLGLAICKRLIELMGGNIHAASAPGTGSTFTFTVPAKIFTRPAAPPPALTSQQTQGGHILLMDDAEDNRLLFSAYLDHTPYTLETAPDGQSGLNMYHHKPYDMILLDLQMPIMDGFTVAKTIRENERVTGKHIPIVAISAYALQEDIDKTRSAGCDGHLAKPVGRDALLAALATHLPPKSTK